MASTVDIIINAKDNASGVLNGISKTMGNIAKAAGIAATAASAAFIALGKQALDATAEWERMTLTMESLVAREIKSADATLTMADALEQATPKAQELLQWIQKLAIQSPFDMAGVQLVYQQALTYGFASDRAQELTQVLIDMSAGMGLTSESMGLVSYALGQINQSDRLLMQDLRQLMNAGVPVNDILNEMGYSLADVGNEAISTDEFINRFIDTMKSDFQGTAARQTNTWAGLINSLGDLKKMGLRELFAGIFDVFQPFVAKFTEWLQGPGLERLREMGNILGGLAAGLIQGIQKLKTTDFSNALVEKLGAMWVNLTGRFSEMMASVDWNALSQSMAEKIDAIDWSVAGNALITGVQNMLMGVWNVVSNVDWGGLFDSITMATAEFIAGMFGSSFEEVRANADLFWADLAARFQAGVQSISGFFTGLFDSVAALASTVTGAVGSAIMTVIGGIQGAFEGIASAVQGVIDWVLALADTLAKLAIPDWLTPGSPTPFEMGLRGIADALREVNSVTSRANVFQQAAPATVQPSAASMVNVSITYAPMVSTASVEEFERNITPAVNRIIRKARRQ